MLTWNDLFDNLLSRLARFENEPIPFNIGFPSIQAREWPLKICFQCGKEPNQYGYSWDGNSWDAHSLRLHILLKFSNSLISTACFMRSRIIEKHENPLLKFQSLWKIHEVISSKLLLLPWDTATDGAPGHSFSKDLWSSIHSEVLCHHLLSLGNPYRYPFYFHFFTIFLQGFCWRN